MIVGADGVAAIGSIAALWIAGAAALVIASVRQLRRADVATAALRSREALLAAGPALSLIVGPDLRLEGSQRLADLLGSNSLPRLLADLGDALQLISASWGIFVLIGGQRPMDVRKKP